jgi:hypothetical protein
LQPICQSIAGFIPSSPFTGNIVYQKLTPVLDQGKESELTFYSHTFLFETFIEFTNSQEVSQYDLNALVNISFDLKDAVNGNIISTINLNN